MIGERERILGGIPDELHPAPEENERRRGPEAEPLRVADCAGSAERKRALERAARRRKRADEVPRVPDEAVTMPSPTQKSTQTTIVAGFSKKSFGPKPAHDGVDEGEREDDEPSSRGAAAGWSRRSHRPSGGVRGGPRTSPPGPRRAPPPRPRGRRARSGAGSDSRSPTPREPTPRSARPTRPRPRKGGRDLSCERVASLHGWSHKYRGARI